MGDPKKAGVLVPKLKDLRAIKACAEAVGMPVEKFADQFGDLVVMFRKHTEDDEHLPLKDFDQAVHQLSDALKVQDVAHKSPEDAFLCGAALGWMFAGYVGLLYKPQPKEE
jgi:hypothetical protein